MAADRPPIIRGSASLCLVLPDILYPVVRRDRQRCPGHIQFLFLVTAVEQTHGGIAALQGFYKDLEVLIEAGPIALLSQRVLVDRDHILICQNSLGLSGHMA